MKKDILKKVLIGSLVVTFAITGCGKVAKLENGKDAIVTLDKNNSISVDEYYEKLKASYGVTILMDMIDAKLLNAKYATNDDYNEQVEAQINSWIASVGDEATLLQQASYTFGTQTMDELKDYVLLQLKRTTAIEDYAKSLVTEEEINKYYEEVVFGDINANHILIMPEVKDSMTEAEKTAAEAKALKEAQDLINKLNNKEITFEEAAKQYSDDEGTKANGGALGAFSFGTMDESFEKAAKELEVGKYSATPVKSVYGFHIILKNSAKEKPALDSIKDKIIEKISYEKLNKDASIEISALEALRKEYNMNIQDDKLKEAFDNYIANVKENANQSTTTN